MDKNKYYIIITNILRDFYYIFPYYGKGSILCSLGEFCPKTLFWDATSEEWLYLGIYSVCVYQRVQSVAGNVGARILIYRIIIE